jgi:hypothetical protein
MDGVDSYSKIPASELSKLGNKGIWANFSCGAYCKTTKWYKNVKCLHCNAIMQGKLDLMKIHVTISCKDVPVETKSKIMVTMAFKTKENEIIENDYQKQQTKMDSYFDKKILTKQQMETLCLLWCRALISTDCPFNIMENLHVRKFFNTLKESFVLPSRNSLMSNYAPKLFASVTLEKCKRLEDQDCLTLILALQRSAQHIRCKGNVIKKTFCH